MRVVSDSSSGPQMRRTDDSSGALSTAPAALPVPEKPAGLPILGAALFVIACAVGGAVVAIVRPLGLG